MVYNKKINAKYSLPFGQSLVGLGFFLRHEFFLWKEVAGWAIIFYKLVITLCTNMYQPASTPKGCQVSRRIWHAGAISQWRKTCFKIPPFVPVNLPRIIVTSSDSFSSKIVYWRLVNASWQETQDVHEIPFGGELSEEGTTNTSGKREIVRLSCSWSSGRGEDCVFQAFRKWLKRSWSKLSLRLFTKNVFLKQKGHGTFLGVKSSHLKHPLEMDVGWVFSQGAIETISVVLPCAEERQNVPWASCVMGEKRPFSL